MNKARRAKKGKTRKLYPFGYVKKPTTVNKDETFRITFWEGMALELKNEKFALSACLQKYTQCLRYIRT